MIWEGNCDHHCFFWNSTRSTYVTDCIWCTHVADCIWCTYVTDCIWCTYVTDCIWRTYVTDCIWCIYVTDCIWRIYVTDCIWCTYVADCIWCTYVADCIWCSTVCCTATSQTIWLQWTWLSQSMFSPLAGRKKKEKKISPKTSTLHSNALLSWSQIAWSTFFSRDRRSSVPFHVVLTWS